MNAARSPPRRKYSFEHVGGPLHVTIVDVVEGPDGSVDYVARILRTDPTRVSGSGTLRPA